MAPLYLQSWLHKIVSGNLKTDAGFRRFMGRDRIDNITRADVDAYRDFNLKRSIQYAYSRSSYYRDLFDQNRLKPESIRGFDDLLNIPLTEPGLLAEYPYRFLCTSQADVARPCIFVTSGTTGPQKEIFWSRWDLDRITDFMSAGIGTVATPRDTVQILLFDGKPDSQADLLRRGVLKIGAVPVVSGAQKSSEEQLRILDEAHSSILFGYTGQIYRISKELQSVHDLKSKKVKVLFLAGEYLPDARRRELESIWNCRVHTHYGLTEMGLGVAVECDARNGYHFNEADLILEIIDPGTGERVKDGEEGELVFTTLTREAMPLIRYRTHDISRFISESCRCGASCLLKFDAVRKRLGSVVTLGNGAEIYPSYFDDLLFENPDIIDYQVRLTRERGKDRLNFKIELAGKQSRIPEGLNRKLLAAQSIAENITAGTMVEPRVELAGPGSLRTTDRSKKMIVDTR